MGLIQGWKLRQARLGFPTNLSGLPAALQLHSMVLTGRTCRALGAGSSAKWPYLLRYFTDLLACKKYLPSLHNLIPPDDCGIKFLAQAVLAVL